MTEKRMIEVLRSTILRAGNEVLSIRDQGELNPMIKEDGSILTIADQRSQQIIVDGLSKLKVSFLAEEKDDGTIAAINEQNQNSPYLVIADPIDGTRPFKTGRDDFCISVAIIKDGRPVIGAIYAPAQGLLYFASKSAGAHLINVNKEVSLKLKITDNHDFQQMKLSINPRELLKGCYYECFNKFGFVPIDLEKVRQGSSDSPDKRLLFGFSTALVFCQVASGKADFAMALVMDHKPESDGSAGKTGGRQIYQWDIAAADIIIHQAGGCVTDFEGNKIHYGTSQCPVLTKHAIASNSEENHYQLLKRITDSIDYEKIYFFNHQ